MNAVADTSFIVAVAVQTDRQHQQCVSTLRQFERVLLPQSTIVEISFLLTRSGGNRAAAHFFGTLGETKYVPVALIEEDFRRPSNLLTQYADARIDFGDATIAAVAERLSIKRILTLNQRDFSILHPTHVAQFELLPPLS
jgi:predicted nucleic acid-binding protein